MFLRWLAYRILRPLGGANTVITGGMWKAEGFNRVWRGAGLDRSWKAEGFNRIWKGGSAMAGMLVANALQKSPGDIVRLYLDLGDAPELIAGGTISGATVTIVATPPVANPAPGGVTAGTTRVETNGYQVSAVFTGGTAGPAPTVGAAGTSATDYTVKWTVTVTGGVTIYRECPLQVM